MTRASATQLRRMLNPASVAIVGASDKSTQHSIPALLASGLDVFLVNPRRETVFGQRAYPDLAAIGRPVDAVYSLVDAAASVGVVEQAGREGAAGVVVRAAGFAEMGEEGAALQTRLVSAASDAGLAVLGPNCNGFINVAGRAFVSGVPRLELRAGRLGVVSHSGGMLTDIGNAAHARGIGFSTLISTGNEAVTGVAECIDYFIDDPATHVIALVLEAIRDPARFFDAADRARAAGKAIVALKLGRSSRGREVAASHTGAVTGEPWVYDAVFRQHGILAAADLSDLMDRVALFEQLPPDRWAAMAGLGVLTISGGAAALAGDIAEEEGVPLPAVASVASVVTAAVPHISMFNPVDFTGFVHGRPDVFRGLVEAYASAPETDSVLLIWTVDPNSEKFSESVVGPFAEVARDAGKPMMLTSLDSSEVGAWAADLARGAGIGLGRGLRATMRSISSMADFARGVPVDDAVAPSRLLDAAGYEIVASSAGPMLGFDSAMRLLGAAGVPVSPYLMLDAVEDVAAGLAGLGSDLFVVKLADVPHRTELGAVRLGVTASDLGSVADELREIARRHDVPSAIVVQAMETLEGELIVGLDTTGELGALVVVGFGGILVEVLGKASARLAPIGPGQAREMVREFDTAGVLTGLRGKPAWDEHSLAELTAAVSRIADAAPWIVSLDINPLIWSGTAFRAADALVLVEGGSR